MQVDYLNVPINATVSVGDAVVVAYPASRAASSYDVNAAHTLTIGQSIYTAPAAFTVDFGDSNITLTIGAAIPAIRPPSLLLLMLVRLDQVSSGEFVGNLDDVPDGSIRVALSPSQRTKLSGIQTGATRVETLDDVADSATRLALTPAERTKLGNVGAAESYRGTWNANTNSPALASGVGTTGYAYAVSVAGSTNLDGVSSWAVGDKAIFSGSVWQKIAIGSTAAPASHVGAGGDAEHPDATDSLSGFMSAEDKEKLDGIDAGAGANPDSASDLEMTTGTETGERLMSPAQIKLAVEEFALESIPADGTGITNSQMVDMSAERIKGRAVAAGAGAPQDMTAAQVRAIINVSDGAAPNPTQVSGGEIAAGTETALRSFSPKDVKDIAVAHAPSAPDASITNAKLANVSTSTLKGRATAGSGAPEDLSASQVRTIINVADGATAAGATGDAFASSHPSTGHAAATTSADGFMSAADKTKLDGVASGAQTRPTQVSGGEITAGTETGVRGWSPADVKDAVEEHAPAAVIGDGTVARAKLADAVDSRIIGRKVGAGTGAPQDMTPAEARAVAGISKILAPLFQITPGSAFTNLKFLDTPASGANVATYAGGKIEVDAAEVASIRFEIQVLVEGSTNVKIALRYSVDGGTTWKWLDDSTSTAGAAPADATAAGALGAGTTGHKKVVVALPAAARTNSTLFHWGSFGGTGTGDSPQLGMIQALVVTGAIPEPSTTIPADSVDNTELANMAASTLKGRAAGAGTGDPQDLTPTQARTLLNVADGASAAGATGDAFAASHPAAGHAVATTSVSGFMSATDKAKLDGVAAGAQTNPAQISAPEVAAPDGVTALRSFSPKNVADIAATKASTPPDGTVTNAKLANVATATLKGRATAGTGSPEDLTPAQGRAILNVADGAQANPQAATDGEVTAGTSTAARTFTPAQIKLSAQTFGGPGGSVSLIAGGGVNIAQAGSAFTFSTDIRAGKSARTWRAEDPTLANGGLKTSNTAAQNKAALDDLFTKIHNNSSDRIVVEFPAGTFAMGGSISPCQDNPDWTDGGRMSMIFPKTRFNFTGARTAFDQVRFLQGGVWTEADNWSANAGHMYRWGDSAVAGGALPLVQANGKHRKMAVLFNITGCSIDDEGIDVQGSLHLAGNEGGVYSTGLIGVGGSRNQIGQAKGSTWGRLKITGCAVGMYAWRLGTAYTGGDLGDTFTSAVVNLLDIRSCGRAVVFMANGADMMVINKATWACMDTSYMMGTYLFIGAAFFNGLHGAEVSLAVPNPKVVEIYGASLSCGALYCRGGRASNGSRSFSIVNVADEANLAVGVLHNDQQHGSQSGSLLTMCKTDKGQPSTAGTIFIGGASNDLSNINPVDLAYSAIGVSAQANAVRDITFSAVNKEAPAQRVGGLESIAVIPDYGLTTIPANSTNDLFLPSGLSKEKNTVRLAVAPSSTGRSRNGRPRARSAV